MTGTVLTEEAGDGVRVVTLNRPQRLNAITPELLEELIAALQAADRDPVIRAVVLTGAGRAFCAGDDLKEFGSQSTDEASTRAYIERIQDVTRAMLLGDTPVIGAVRGWAVGGGLEWVINCDFAIAAEGTRFFFPEISLGVFVTGGVTELLPRDRRPAAGARADHAGRALRCGAGARVGPGVQGRAGHGADAAGPRPCSPRRRIAARSGPRSQADSRVLQRRRAGGRDGGGNRGDDPRLPRSGDGEASRRLRTIETTGPSADL